MYSVVYGKLEMASVQCRLWEAGLGLTYSVGYGELDRASVQCRLWGARWPVYSVGYGELDGLCTV